MGRSRCLLDQRSFDRSQIDRQPGARRRTQTIAIRREGGAIRFHVEEKLESARRILCGGRSPNRNHSELLHQACRGYDLALATLLEELNRTRTPYPGTNLRLVYEILPHDRGAEEGSAGDSAGPSQEGEIVTPPKQIDVRNSVPTIYHAVHGPRDLVLSSIKP